MSHDDDDTSLASTWAAAAGFDPVLRITTPAVRQALRRRQLHPRPYARDTLFDAVAHNRPVLLSGVPVPVAGAARHGLQPALLRALARAFEDEAGQHGRTVSVQVDNRRRRRLAVPALVAAWQSDQRVVSVTDLHVRGTTLERDIDTDQLSTFNLLPRGSEDMQRQEMMTLVVSSRGNVTDSHSDDPDGSNHCFVGRKLWLAWETFEGQAAGLEDCSRDLVNERARFDLGAFCRLRSACWWTVDPGTTLFLPGRLSHRVVTLAPYIGIGSFYCTPASCLENLGRWYVHGALWALDDPRGDNAGLVDEIARSMARLLQQLSRRRPALQQAWGLDFSAQALDTWHRSWPAAQRRQLLAIPAFAAVVREMEALAGRDAVPRPAARPAAPALVA